MVAVSTAVSVGAPDVLYPRLYVGGTANASAQVLLTDGTAVQGAGVTFLWRAPDQTQVEIAGIWDAAGLTWRCAREVDTSGTWAVRMRCTAPQRQTDWMLFEVVDAPEADTAPGAAIWLAQSGQPLVTTNGGLLTGVRLDQLEAAGDLDRTVRLPGVVGAVEPEVRQTTVGDVADFAKAAADASSGLAAQSAEEAEQSASAAADALAAAAQKVIDATEQVTLASNQADRAAAQVTLAAAQVALADAARVLAEAAANNASSVISYASVDTANPDWDWLLKTLAGWIIAGIRKDGGLALNHTDLSPSTTNGALFEVKTRGGLQFALIDALKTAFGGGTLYHTGKLELANGLTIHHDPSDTSNILQLRTEGGLIMAQLTRAGLWRVKNLEADNLSSSSGAVGVDTVARNLQRYPLQSATVRGAAGLANWTLSDGTQSSFDQKMLFHTGTYGVTFPQLEWINVGEGHPPADGPNPVTLRASIEYPAGVYTPIWFDNGSRDITIQPGGWARTLPVPVAIPADTDWWMHQYVQVPTGGKWIRSAWGGIPSSWASPGVDRTMGAGGAYTDSNQLVAFGPTIVAGKPIGSTLLLGSADVPVFTVEIDGDSISTGTGDGLATGESTLPPRGCGGFIGRALWDLRLPFIHNGKGGNSMAVDGDRTKRINRAHAWRYAKFVICNLGTNDSGLALQDWKDGYQRLNDDIVRTGGILIPCTMSPRTNVTNTGMRDGDTSANISFIANGNAWLRADPFGNGIFDFAAAVVDPNDATRWNSIFAIPSGFDGLHPMPDAHLAGAKALKPRLLTLLAK